MVGSGREIQKGTLLLFVTAYIQSKKQTQQRLFGGMGQKLYEISVSKEGLCKHAKSMLNVSGFFFIACGVF